MKKSLIRSIKKILKLNMKKINKKLFKKVMSKFSTGITVVGINVKGINIAKTINSFTTLSISPPLVLFSLDINASYLNKFKKSKFLSINILGKNQTDISNIFAKKDPKWKKVNFDLGEFKTPIIKNCLANLECKKTKLLMKGDHIIFICEVLNASFNDKIKPLIYFDSNYFN